MREIPAATADELTSDPTVDPATDPGLDLEDLDKMSKLLDLVCHRLRRLREPLLLRLREDGADASSGLARP